MKHLQGRIHTDRSSVAAQLLSNDTVVPLCSAAEGEGLRRNPKLLSRLYVVSWRSDPGWEGSIAQTPQPSRSSRSRTHVGDVIIISLAS